MLFAQRPRDVWGKNRSIKDHYGPPLNAKTSLGAAGSLLRRAVSVLKQNSPGGLSPYLDAGAQRIAAELEAHLVITLKHTGRHCGAALGGVPPPHQPIGATSFSPFRMGGRGAALELYPWYSTRVVVHVDTAARVCAYSPQDDAMCNAGEPRRVLAPGTGAKCSREQGGCVLGCKLSQWWALRSPRAVLPWAESPENPTCGGTPWS